MFFCLFLSVFLLYVYALQICLDRVNCWGMCCSVPLKVQWLAEPPLRLWCSVDCVAIFTDNSIENIIYNRISCGRSFRMFPSIECLHSMLIVINHPSSHRAHCCLRWIFVSMQFDLPAPAIEHVSFTMILQLWTSFTCPSLTILIDDEK